MPTKRTGDATISDAAVRARTGKSWAQWFAMLDRWGARERTHKEIAAHLHRDLDVTPWWSQMITVEYERRQRGRKIGERPAAAGFSLDVQRTVKSSPQTAFDSFLSAEHLVKWFTKKARADLRVGGAYSNSDGDTGEFLTLEPPRRARFTWDNKRHCPGTIVEFTVRPSGNGKVAVRVTHSRLKTARDREKMKQGWNWAMDSFKSYLETGQPIPHEVWLKQNV